METADGAWVSVGLIVKVINSKIQGGKYFEAKGTVLKVHTSPACAHPRRYGKHAVETPFSRTSEMSLLLCGCHEQVEGDFIAYVRIQDSKEVLKIEQVRAGACGMWCRMGVDFLFAS